MVSERDVAIVGMACRFPNAPDLQSFWDLLVSGREGVVDYTAGRSAELDAYYAAAGTEFGPLTRRGGFLADVDEFDAEFFRISPREAAYLDPQHRLLLEIGWQALEDAGQVRDRLSGSKTGVFVGLWMADYERLVHARAPVSELLTTVGNGAFGGSGRLAFTFDLRGPEVTVNSACASSLIAIHLAREALAGGRCELALAGAANIIVLPEITQAFARAKMLSEDGSCKFGDVNANGFVRSEGGAVVALKLLSKAREDGDRIHAVIRGSACNNNGGGSGLLIRPSQSGQEAVQRQALEDAGLSPAEVQYVEAHGTGTSVGDPIELGALSEVFGRHPDREHPCMIGSVKSNIGHTEAAAGVAGLIKTVLAIKHGFIPPTLHVTEPNPNVDWAQAGLALATDGKPWPSAKLRRAGVNSFGLTGANAHIVIEEAGNAGEPAARGDAPATRSAWILPVTAHSENAVKSLALDYAERVETAADLADVCFTASKRRTHFAHRVVACGNTGAEIAARLRLWAKQGQAPFTAHGVSEEHAAGVVFIFPGQGSQWAGMGLELLESEPVFAAAIEECDAAIHLEAGWSLVDRLRSAGDDKAASNSIDVIQPMLVSMEVALAKLWMSWGIKPAAVLGHSMGEIAAAHVSGILSLRDAIAIVSRRSKLMRRFSGKGAMALVELSAAEAEAVLLGRENRISVAVCNGPRSTVLSGDPSEMKSVLQELEKRNVFCRSIAVDVAAHSPQMEAISEELRQAIADVKPSDGPVPFYSTTLGRWIAGHEADASYWVENLRRPVLFHQALVELLNGGYKTFLEASPHPLLIPTIQEVCDISAVHSTTVASLRRDEPQQATLLEGLATLFTAGHPVHWNGIYRHGNVVDLPALPWQKKRFWINGKSDGRRSFAATPGAHPLLGAPLVTAGGEWIWAPVLSHDLITWAKDHAVQDTVFLPASAYVEIAIAAQRQITGDGAHGIAELVIKEAIALSSDGPVQIQIIAAQESFQRRSIRFYVRGFDPGQWTLAARCIVEPISMDAGRYATEKFTEASREKVVEPAQHAELMEGAGYSFGPSFRCVQWYLIRDNEALGEARTPESVNVLGYELHPVLLDAGFQVLAALFLRLNPNVGQLLPVAIEQVSIAGRRSPVNSVFVHAVLADRSNPVGDVFFYDQAGALLAQAKGLRFRVIERSIHSASDRFLYSLDWQQRPLDVQSDVERGLWLVVTPPGKDCADLVQALRARNQEAVSVSRDELIGSDGTTDARGFLSRVSAVRRSSSVVNVAYLGSVDLASTAPVDAVESGCAMVAKLVKALVEADFESRLVLVTRGAVDPDGNSRINVRQASLWGLGAVIANEHPNLGCRLIDLAPASYLNEANMLAAELDSDRAENRVALRSSGRTVARLGSSKVNSAAVTRKCRTEERFEVELQSVGNLDSFELIPKKRQVPREFEVEIEVHAAGLNFQDVLKALGLYDSTSSLSPKLGGECSGVVTRIGHGVTEFQVGDAVVAVSPSFTGHSLFASHTTIPAALVAMKPEGIDFQEAAAIPAVYLTVYYALNKIAKLRAGETVLIHSATGGVGLAAIDIAKSLGAEAYCSAGSVEKRSFLRSLGIKHVFDSRSPDFATELRALTGGGVDVVLNSLTGVAIPEGLRALAPYGRFLEIGKRDMWENSKIGMSSFLLNRTFAGIDLAALVEDHPDLAGSMLREIMKMFDKGVLSPAPVTAFPASRASDAFRHMARAEHTGKIVVDMKDPRVRVRNSDQIVEAEATYLVTGGAGALGLVAAEELVGLGARNLVLLGRAAPSASAAEVMDALRGRGANVAFRSANLADENEVKAVLSEIAATMPPLRGIVHLAGVLDDTLVAELEQKHFNTVMEGKVKGALVLDRLTAAMDLAFFVMFSSAAATLGLAGQGNYAAANAMLDALAHDRISRGLPAKSINWGPWAEIGLAAQQSNRGERVARQGLESLSPEEGRELFRRALSIQAPQFMAARFDASRWRTSLEGAAQSRIFDDLIKESAVSARPAVNFAATVRAANREGALSLLRQCLCEQIAAVLHLESSQVPHDKPLRSLGLDSLMGLEFRNRLERAVDVKLSASVVWNYPTVEKLAVYLVDMLGFTPEDAPLSSIQAGMEALMTELGAAREVLGAT